MVRITVKRNLDGKQHFLHVVYSHEYGQDIKIFWTWVKLLEWLPIDEENIRVIAR